MARQLLKERGGTRVGLADIAASPVDWRIPRPGDVAVEVELNLHAKKRLRPHQADALEAVFAGFASHDRGRLIMACGTGKTFTSLKVDERLQRERADRVGGQRTSVLFLVPFHRAAVAVAAGVPRTLESLRTCGERPPQRRLPNCTASRR